MIHKISGDTPEDTISARDIWIEMEIKSHFSHWIQRRIKQACLIENEDCKIFIDNNGSPGPPLKEYILTINAAKHVVMLEATPKGKEIRDRLIKIEKRARNLYTSTQTMSSEEKANRVITASLEVAELLGIPKYIAQQEAIKQAKIEVGVDYTPMLNQAPAQENIPKKDIMLEPSEIALKLGFTECVQIRGNKVNKILANMGWQTGKGGDWNPTEKGRPYCSSNAQLIGTKTVYNWKWKLEKFMEEYVKVLTKGTEQ